MKTQAADENANSTKKIWFFMDKVVMYHQGTWKFTVGDTEGVYFNYKKNHIPYANFNILAEHLTISRNYYQKEELKIPLHK